MGINLTISKLNSIYICCCLPTPEAFLILSSKSAFEKLLFFLADLRLIAGAE